MRRTALGLALVAGTLAMSAAPAIADTTPTQPPGPLVIFSTELQPLAVMTDPSGCVSTLPPLAHLAVNLTDKPVRAYALPGCVGAVIWTMQPGYGVHTAGFGSLGVG